MGSNGDAHVGPAAGEPTPRPYYRVRLLLASGAAAAAILFWFAARSLGLPYYAGFEASLMLQPSPGGALVATGVLFLAATAIGTLIAGSVRLDAGLFAAAVGLAVLTLRGGPSRSVVQSFASPSGYFLLAFETAVLFAFIAMAWFGLWVFHRKGRLRGDVSRDGIADAETTAVDKLTALATQTLVTALVVFLLAPTDDKKQVLAAVSIAGLAGSMTAYALSPVQRSIWYVAGPFAVAFIGYLAATTSTANGPWRHGPTGLLANLARPLPLDYASLGTAGALLGYWMGRRAQRTREETIAQAADATAAA